MDKELGQRVGTMTQVLYDSMTFCTSKWLDKSSDVLLDLLPLMVDNKNSQWEKVVPGTFPYLIMAETNTSEKGKSEVTALKWTKSENYFTSLCGLEPSQKPVFSQFNPSQVKSRTGHRQWIHQRPRDPIISWFGGWSWQYPPPLLPGTSTRLAWIHFQTTISIGGWNIQHCYSTIRDVYPSTSCPYFGNSENNCALNFLLLLG